MKIILKHGGYKKLADCGFEKLFNARVKELFSKDVHISFDGQLEDEELVLPPPEAPKPIVNAAPKKEQPKAETKISFEKKEHRYHRLESM